MVGWIARKGGPSFLTSTHWIARKGSLFSVYFLQASTSRRRFELLREILHCLGAFFQERLFVVSGLVAFLGAFKQLQGDICVLLACAA